MSYEREQTRALASWSDSFDRHQPDALTRLAATACRVLDAEAAWIASRDGATLRFVASHPFRHDGSAAGVACRAFLAGQAEDSERGLAAAAATIGDERLGVLAVRHGVEDFGERRFDTLEDLASVAAPLLRREAGTDAAEVAVAALAAAVRLHDGYTACHGDEVLFLAYRVGLRLGLDGSELRDLAFAARMHDLGKLAIADTILNKPGPLEVDEWSAMHRHPAVGASTLAAIPGLEAAATIVRSHHERWDGTGYPDGLKQEAIPRGSRILAACDAYRAMVEDRPYRLAMTAAAARAELEADAGTHFDPAVVAALCRILD